MNREVVDVFDILRPVRAEGSSMVHLAPYNWDTRGDSTTLCDLKISPAPPSVTFQRDGCFRCARHAVSVGIGAFREGERVVVYLSRFLQRTPGDGGRQ
jgi:hypothetical protein